MSREEARECPRCKDYTIAFDYLTGMMVCELCGLVIRDEEDLVPTMFTSCGRPTGRLVKDDDSGAGTSAQLHHMSGAGRLMQGSQPRDPLVKRRQVLAQITSNLALSPQTAQEADRYLQELGPILGGRWKRELLVSSAVYTAIRQMNLPLTLLDLSGAIQLDIYTLGKYYQLASRALGVVPPQVLPEDLLPRAFAKVLGRGLRDKELESDARMAVGWMDTHAYSGQRRPILTVSAAVILALEMNHMDVGWERVAQDLNVSLVVLTLRLQRVRDKLLQVASLLPYGARVTSKTVLSHSRTLMRLSNVLGPVQVETAAPSIEGPDSEEGPLLLAAPKKKKRAALVSITASLPGPGGGGGGGGTAAAGAKRKTPVSAAPEAEKHEKRVRFEDSPSAPTDSAARTTPAIGPAVFSSAPSLETAAAAALSAAAEVGGEVDEDGLSQLEMSDSELDAYLRTDEEVEMLKQIHEHVEHADMGLNARS